MKRLTILVPDGQSSLSTVASIVGACEMFATANAYWKRNGQKELFDVELAGVSKQTHYHDGAITIRPQVNISNVRATNLIIIPASLIRSYKKSERTNQLLIDWLTKQYKQGAEIASICSGAFTLASSGLLDGKACSTHWAHAEEFRSLFPSIDLKEEKLITDENGIYTNGGAYSFLNLLIYLIEKYYDRPTAIYCSKVFQVDIDRQDQSPFIIFSGQKSHGDEVIKKAQAYIESNVEKKISVVDLSSRFAIGRRHFDRRFIKATGNSPLEYSQRVKIESAKRAFETSRKTVHEVMYDVGYSDLKAFREVFRKFTGMSPMDYQSKYNKDGMRVRR